MSQDLGHLTPEGHHEAAIHEAKQAQRAMSGNDRLYHLGLAQFHATMALYKPSQPQHDSVRWTDRG